MIDKKSYRKIELIKGCGCCDYAHYTNKILICGNTVVEHDHECKNFMTVFKKVEKTKEKKCCQKKKQS